VRTVNFFKKTEDEWDILDEEYQIAEEPPEEQREKKKRKKNKKPKVNVKKKKADQAAAGEIDENIPEITPVTIPDTITNIRHDAFAGCNALEDDEIDYLNSDYVYDPYEHRPRWRWGWLALLFFILTAAMLLAIGAVNTDYDDEGTAYFIPLEIHYERRYVRQSDIVLNHCLEIANTIDNDASLLINNFVYLSTKLSNEQKTLKDTTTELSRFVGVPTSMEGYHTALLNFSIKTQEFIQTLLSNYTHPDYDLFKEKGITDLKNELSTLLILREQIDTEIFRNMNEGKGGSDPWS